MEAAPPVPVEAAKTETRTGQEPRVEKWFEQYLGNAIHLFLSLLALLIFVAAMITTVDVIIRDFPKLWQPLNEYSVLQEIILTILLIAIAAELGLLLLFHRTTAAIEVIIFVIARKLVGPDITVTGLLLGTLAIVGLVITRFYYLPGRAK
jgi:hypothetical protein